MDFLNSLADSFIRTFIIEDRWRLVLAGLQVTVVISLFSLIFGTLFGALVCAMRRSKFTLTAGIAKVYIRIIQGVPAVTLLMILYYVIFGKVDIEATIVAVIGFSLNFAAYTSEMFRTGIDAVEKGQLEAAAASGFSKLQVFRLITLPQAAMHVIPVYRGEFISMVKMTAVVGYIAIQDLTKVSDIIRSRTYEAFFPLAATSIIYFIITYLSISALSIIEIKIDPKRRRRMIKGVSPQ
jgi:polar amino acid transport system substrate-binding protein